MTQEFHISVGPVAGGWAVEYGQGLAPMLFLSGAQAEAQARALARRLSQHGGRGQLDVRDRSLALVAALNYVAVSA
jgi:hypothetical protein